MLEITYGAFPLHGTVHFWGVFHWVLYLVIFCTTSAGVPSVTKMWPVNSADHWLAGENHHYCHWTCDTIPNIDPLDLNQHRQRRSGRNYYLKKRTLLYQPKNSCFVVCLGSTYVPLIDSRGADIARAWWGDAEWKSLVYTLFALCIILEYVFCLYFYKQNNQIETIWLNKCTSRLYIKMYYCMST